MAIEMLFLPKNTMHLIKSLIFETHFTGSQSKSLILQWGNLTHPGSVTKYSAKRI